MKNYKSDKNVESDHSLGKLSTFLTDDGSTSLHSIHFKEAFHSSSGALREAKEKYLSTAELNRFQNHRSLNVLDVCLGLGYNTASILESIQGKSTKLCWWGLELDKRPLEIALQNKNFLENWSPKVLSILRSIDKFGEWVDQKSQGRIFWGDARQQLPLLPMDLQFDLIFLDPFSPSHCPELWSEEFLQLLAKKLSSGGRLITYCRAAAVRATLRRAGLQLRSIIPSKGQKRDWSAGTIAIFPIKNEEIKIESTRSQLLSPMEEEHLLTRAAIPYRDLSGIDHTKEILNRRTKEQNESPLEKTKDWKQRWNHVLSNKSL